MPAGQGWGAFSIAVERAGELGPPLAGALFLLRNKGKNTKGKGSFPLGTPFWWEKRGRWLVRLGFGLRPPGPTPHGPPTGSGEAGEVVC